MFFKRNIRDGQNIKCSRSVQPGLHMHLFGGLSLIAKDKGIDLITNRQLEYQIIAIDKLLLLIGEDVESAKRLPKKEYNDIIEGASRQAASRIITIIGRSLHDYHGMWYHDSDKYGIDSFPFKLKKIDKVVFPVHWAKDRILHGKKAVSIADRLKDLKDNSQEANEGAA